MTTEPPPTYTVDAQEVPEGTAPTLVQPQIQIVPIASNIGFQKGYLGADLERAAIEGELQIKGAETHRWGKVFVASIIRRISNLPTHTSSHLLEQSPYVQPKLRTGKRLS